MFQFKLIPKSKKGQGNYVLDSLRTSRNDTLSLGQDQFI